MTSLPNALYLRARYVSGGCHPSVFGALRAAYHLKDVALAAKMERSSEKAEAAPEELGLPAAGKYDLRQGVETLSRLNEQRTPADKLACIRAATWAIEGAQALPADELLPLFVSLILRAKPSHLYRYIEIT